MRRLSVALLLSLAACTEKPYNPGILYQAESPNCDRWVDGSRFELPQEISVFASVPALARDGNLELGMAYFVPEGVSTTFATQTFEITLPHGKSVAQGETKAVDRHLKNSTKSPEPLPALPKTLVGEAGGDETMYRFKVVLTPPLPDRFDFQPPDMVVGEKSFHVRTYTYRYFKERNQIGLCS